ncbi:hypothetical protein EON67_12260 [archaeon]|nr:MAG: hypothetical protein EON67_12260 [archaeon]
MAAHTKCTTPARFRNSGLSTQPCQPAVAAKTRAFESSIVSKRRVRVRAAAPPSCAVRPRARALTLPSSCRVTACMPPPCACAPPP